MLITTGLFVVLFCVECRSVQHKDIFPNKSGNQANYYWRDYFGVIPNDAVLGGFNIDGNITYIGQSSHVSHPGIFPGVIYAGKKEGFTCPGNKFVDGTYVKILCANSQLKYEWISTTADDSSVLIDYHWAIGGSQPKTILYIGRVNFEGEVQVGRVYNSQSPHKGLWVCNRAGAQVNFKTFELLVFPR